MSEQARRNLTRAIVGLAIIALIIFAYFRKAEIPRLVNTIANGTPTERMAAVKRLIAKEKLAEAMEDAPRCVQYNCVAALAQIGDNEAMAQMLEAKWEFDDPIEQWCNTLLISWADSAVGPLVDAIQNKSGDIRGGTITALSKIGEPAKAPLLELTGGWDQYVRDGVRDVFAKAEMAPLVRDDLIDLLKERQPRAGETPAKHLRRRGTAVAALQAMLIHAFDPLFALLQCEDDDKAFQAELRGQAAASLGIIADQTKDSPIAVADAVNVIDPLIGALSDPDWTVRRRAAEALGPVCKVKKPPEDPEQLRKLAAPIDPLIGLLTVVGATPDEDAKLRDVRAAAAESLGLIASQRAAQPLGAALANDAQRSGAAQEIALALQRIGGEPAVNALSTALHHGDPDVRELATATLADIGGPFSPGPLAERLRLATEDAVRVRRVAARALRNIAEAAYAPSGSADLRRAMESVLPAIAGALSDTDWHVYVAARDALSRVGQPAVSHLVNAMVGGDPRVSYTAAEGLAKIGGDAVPGLLSAIIKQPESDRARWASIALGDIGSPAVPDLIGTLDNAGLSPAARGNAARALGLSHDARAIGALLEAAKAPVSQIRIQAVRSLADLRGIETEQRTGESAVIAALSDSDPSVRETAMRVLEDWPGVTANEALGRKLELPNDQNTRHRGAVVFASHWRSGMLLGMGAEAAEERGAVRSIVAGLLESALSEGGELPGLRQRALELSGSVAALEYVSKEVIRDPAAVAMDDFISADDIDLTHAACKALAALGARVSREIMRDARVGFTPGASESAKILARHLEAPERSKLAPWYALALSEVRDAGVRTLVDPGDPDDPTLPTGLLMRSEVPTQEQLMADAGPKPTMLWAAAVIGRIGKPAVDALFDARGKLGGLNGKRSLAMERLRKLFANYDVANFHEGAILDAVGDDGKLTKNEFPKIVKFNNTNASPSPESVRNDAETIWAATRQLRWVHAAMAATRDTLARDFVDNVGDFDLLPEDQYQKLEETMDELARLKVAEW